MVGPDPLLEPGARRGLAARLRSSLRKRVMQGRNSPGEWDDAVSEWRREAGDKMRAEYEPARETRY